MPLRTKNRRIQTAELCKLYLRQKYQSVLLFVEAFIIEFDRAATNRPRPAWGQFTNSSWKNEELLMRLDQHFEKWLNPRAR